jgi:hypothetical protein
MQVPSDFRRVIIAASVGNIIEWYDFYIFGSLAAVLSVKFAYERGLGGMVSLRPILRDTRFQRAPQDEVLFRGEILDPHGEERRLRRVSNHEAEYAIGPYAIALRLDGGRRKECIRPTCVVLPLPPVHPQRPIPRRPRP